MFVFKFLQFWKANLPASALVTFGRSLAVISPLVFIPKFSQPAKICWLFKVVLEPNWTISVRVLRSGELLPAVPTPSWVICGTSAFLLAVILTVNSLSAGFEYVWVGFWPVWVVISPSPQSTL